MKIVFVVRSSAAGFWGGDIQVLLEVVEGMKKLGHSARIIDTLNDYQPEEFLFLTNTCHDLRPNHWFAKLYGLKYGLIPFYEDYIHYYGASKGFFMYICNALLEKEDLGYPFTLERLFENPHLIHYYTSSPKKQSMKNYDVLKGADVIIANSHMEANTIKRDISQSDPKIVYWRLGCEQTQPDDEFLRFTGLKKGEYILQVGRIEMRKNQLGTVVATKDFEAPLVFIGTKALTKEYGIFLTEAIKRWRKGPTFIITQDMKPYQSENLNIIHMPEGKKLSKSMLASAFANAGLHLHPAFNELPGATYFESAKYGIPTIASSWTSCEDYFTDQNTGEYTLDDRIEYCEPFHVQKLTELVTKKFGKLYPREPFHPIFHRTKEDVAGEILSAMEQNRAMC